MLCFISKYASSAAYLPPVFGAEFWNWNWLVLGGAPADVISLHQRTQDVIHNAKCFQGTVAGKHCNCGTKPGKCLPLSHVQQSILTGIDVLVCEQTHLDSSLLPPTNQSRPMGVPDLFSCLQSPPAKSTRHTLQSLLDVTSLSQLSTSLSWSSPSLSWWSASLS